MNKNLSPLIKRLLLLSLIAMFSLGSVSHVAAEQEEENTFPASGEVTSSEAPVFSLENLDEQIEVLDEGRTLSIKDVHESEPLYEVGYDDRSGFVNRDHVEVVEVTLEQNEEEYLEEDLDDYEVIDRAVVSHHSLAVRASAGGSADRIGTLTEDDEIEIFEYVDGTSWVKFNYNGAIGYTHLDYLNVLPPQVDLDDYEVIDRAVVSHHSLAVRASASGSADRIGTLTEDDEIEIFEYVDGTSWVKFNYTGAIGYTHLDYLRIILEDPEDLEDKLATGIVDASSRLAIRTEPSGSSTIIDRLNSGTIVDIHEYVDGGPWVKIVYDGTVAYTHIDYLNVIELGDVIDTANVNHDGLVVRERPSGSSTNLGRLALGTEVEIYDIVNGGPWVEISFNGGQAYTHMDYLTFNATGDGPLAGRTIVVDAGHGAHDPGAQGNGLVEKTLNLQIARELAERLETQGGANVIMTRDSDIFLTLSERANIANRANADLFISVHGNADTTNLARGAETFYQQGAGQSSIRLANVMQDRLVSDTGMNYRRVAPANFGVLRESNMPSTLVEVGFLTNSGDAAIMRQSGYPARAGEALYQGFLDYYQ